eukprot:8892484-Lingulodinium_polyedra.AAC.1
MKWLAARGFATRGAYEFGLWRQDNYISTSEALRQCIRSRADEIDVHCTDHRYLGVVYHQP